MSKKFLAIAVALLLSLGALNAPAFRTAGGALAQAQPTPPPQPTQPPQGSGGSSGAQPTQPPQPGAQTQQSATPQPTTAPKPTQAPQKTPAPTPEKYNVSSWAVEYLKKAGDYNLTPDAFKTADLTKPVTRKEFAAVAVKVYENLTGGKITPVSNNPFTDTNDTEVLKAYGAGITSGTNSAGTLFGPDELLSREQMATMLTRVLKAAYIQGWKITEDASYTLNFTQPSKFSDDGSVSDWAGPSVYYMYANNLIMGTDTARNTFSPGESATREQAVTIAVRMVENMKGKKIDYKKGSPGNAQTAQPAQAQSSGTASLAGMWRIFDGAVVELVTFESNGSILVETYETETSHASVLKGKYTVSGDRFAIIDATVDGIRVETAEFPFKVNGDALIMFDSGGNAMYYERIPAAAAEYIRKNPYADVPPPVEKETLYVPAAFLADMAPCDVREDAVKAGAEITENRDGSCSLTVTKEQRQVLLKNRKNELDDFIGMLKGDETYLEFKNIQYNDDYSSITFFSTCGLDEMSDWSKLMFYMVSYSAPLYQVYEGKGESAKSVVSLRDPSTNALIGIYVSPDGLKGMY